MPERPRPDHPGKSAREQWEQAASHRAPEDPDDPRSDDARPRVDSAQRDAFLHTRDGAFYPSGHAVLGLDPNDARALRDALEAAGFAHDSMMLLTSEEAAALMRESDDQAGLLARVVGAEIRNARVMRQLAESGTAFLIVRVADDDTERALVSTAQRWRVRKALRYHTLAIEELRVGVEEIPGDSPFGVNEVLRSKPSDARLKPRN